MLSLANDPVASPPPSRPPGPFDPGQDDLYRSWRAVKLAAYPRSAEELRVSVRDPYRLTAQEHVAIARRCQRCNMAVYAGPAEPAPTDLPRALARQFGLSALDHNWLADDDGISSIAVRAGTGRGEYIPYTDRPIRWHTDGYYNPPSRTIRAMVLHCVRPAAQGGETAVLDHEMAYLALRDADPRLALALQRPDAMTIPARESERGVARAEETGPVFSVDPDDGTLHMRYTARTRSIEWSPDPDVRAAAAFLERLLAGESPFVLRLTLGPGMGLICNNVLHDRSGFTDDPGRPRLLYRARYHDRLRLDP